MAVLYENNPFSIQELLIEKTYSSFLKKIFFFQKISFKVKFLKSFKLFWKSLLPIFRRIYALTLLALKLNL